MTDIPGSPPEGPNIVELVKPGGPGLTKEGHVAIEKMMRNFRVANGQFLQELNNLGVTIDPGMEAVFHLRWFLKEMGVITEDQYLAISASWEATFHDKLRSMLQQMTKPALITPQNFGVHPLRPKGGG